MIGRVPGRTTDRSSREHPCATVIFSVVSLAARGPVHAQRRDLLLLMRFTRTRLEPKTKTITTCYPLLPDRSIYKHVPSYNCVSCTCDCAVWPDAALLLGALLFVSDFPYTLRLGFGCGKIWFASMKKKKKRLKKLIYRSMRIGVVPTKSCSRFFIVFTIHACDVPAYENVWLSEVNIYCLYAREIVSLRKTTKYYDVCNYHIYKYKFNSPLIRLTIKISELTVVNKQELPG